MRRREKGHRRSSHINHAEAMEIHSVRRAFQRYGQLDRELVRTLGHKIKAERDQVCLEQVSTSRTIHAVKHERRLYQCVYSKTHHQVVTLLPPFTQEEKRIYEL